MLRLREATAVLEYWLTNGRTPGDSIGKALLLMGLEGETYERFGEELTKYRFRHVQGGGA